MNSLYSFNKEQPSAANSMQSGRLNCLKTAQEQPLIANMKASSTTPSRFTGYKKSFDRRIILSCLCLLMGIVVCAQAENVVWSENFDDGNADNRWYADQGVWQIGSPTVGPATNSATGYRTHSGSECVTTGLNGNYLSDQDSRFIRIQSFTVPPTNQYPHLNFWHWYSFAGPAGYPYYDDGSYGYVEIKTATGNWQQITNSPTYKGWGGGIWWHASIDLAPYAGQTVQIAFYFHSTHNTDVGWYIDDVELVTNSAPVFSNPEGFEHGMGDWTIEYSGSDSPTWQIGSPTNGPGGAYDGTNCAATSLAGDYNSDCESSLVSPPFVVPGTNQFPCLRFWHWYSFAGPAGYPYYDDGSYGYVEIKTATGNWQQIANSPTYKGWGGGIWWHALIDLAPYAGQTVQIAFHFHSTHNTDVGWYIDDVELVTNSAPVFSNPEGFEHGMGDWTIEYSGSDSPTWQIGSPTNGPGEAYDGSNCAATSLAGDYNSDCESSLVSPPFMVPPAASNPALRFWHWFNFAGAAGYPYYDDGSYGYVEIKAGTNNWEAISSHYSGQSGAWTQPYFPLNAYAGQTVQIAFHFHSTHNVSSGWYIDDVRLVHDFVAQLLNSPVVRTQDEACVSLGIAADAPVSAVNFLIQAPGGNLSSPTLTTISGWTGTITPQSGSQWLVTLHSSSTNALMGVQDIGSICWTAVSVHSAFVPLSVNDLVVTNLNGSQPTTVAAGSRAVVIANEPLLESWLGTNNERMVTVYGKANTGYDIRQATNITEPFPWSLAWTNTVPSDLFTNSPVQGSLSNAPVLFLNANEQ